MRRILATRSGGFGVFSAIRRWAGIGAGEEESSALDAGLDQLPFDAAFYLRANPDVAASGIDPYDHYRDYGRHEGRLGAPPKIEYSGDVADLDPGRETVLVVTHEATLSGVPVLSLNIIEELKKRYNVVGMLLDSGTFIDNGPLTASFRQTADLLVKPDNNGRNFVVVSAVLDQLVKDCTISFAIVNSIESRWALPGLVRNGIPAISLIHEFAAYTRPRGAFWEVAFWSSDTVFSAPVVLKDALDAYPSIASSTFHVIPQGRCELPTSKVSPVQSAKERGRVLHAMRPRGDDDAIVILGAGNVHMRKGVDLFLDCAARILRKSPVRNFRFVWIGRGFDPEQDSYSLFLADQVRRAGLEKHVAFLAETTSLEVAYSAADVMMISSRLDPLPNVAIDAMAHGKPVVCFAETTGIADLLVEHGLQSECVASYLDTAELADKTYRLICSDDLRASVGATLRSVVREHLDMGRYVDGLVSLAQAAKTRADQERADIAEIIGSNQASDEFLLDFHQRGTPFDEAVRTYTRAWSSRISQRKPFAGFHPGVYRDMNVPASYEGDPLAHYLRSGQPKGPWLNEVISNRTRLNPLPSGARIALHVHVFYPELLKEILEQLAPNAARPDLFISVPSARIKQEIEALLDAYAGRVADIVEVPNRGRDIGPFLTAFGATIAGHYDFVGHLHTKKSLHCPDPGYIERWRYFLIENLLGGENRMADIILGKLAEDPSIGMIFPDDPGAGGWDQNRSYAVPLAERIGIPSLPDQFLFPMGSMFWARVDALRPLFDLSLHWDAYPQEPIHHDGTVLHAIERLFGIVACQNPYRIVTTSIPGVTR